MALPVSDIPPLAAPSLGHLIRRRARISPAATFLRFEGRTLSFGELERRTNQCANALAGLGIAKGDRVGVMLPNGLEFPTYWLGITKLGAVVVPININYREADLGYILRDSGARLVITDSERVERVRTVAATCPEVERVLLGAPNDGSSSSTGPNDDRFDRLLTQSGAELSIDHLGSTDLATLQYTSGTTGFPKGCILTHEFWIRQGSFGADLKAFSPSDVMLITTPFYYGDAGWNMSLCLQVGMELVILPKFSASTFWRSVKETGTTFFYCLGTMPVLLLKQPEDPAVDRGHQVRFVSCSGIPPQLHAEIERRWGVPWREAYGTTEIGGALIARLEWTDTVGTGALGRSSPGYQVRLIDEQGHDVPDGAIGQLIVRGPGLSLGYWNKPEATAAWMKDGWAHTGDLMYRDPHGYYHIVGRLKDMIRRGGENIAAAEVEAALAEHPAVRSAACVAVPDEIRGEEVRAFVLLNPNSSPETVSPTILLDHCRARLAGFKVPRFISYVDQLPLTPSQRVEKHRLPHDRTGAFDAVTNTWN